MAVSIDEFIQTLLEENRDEIYLLEETPDGWNLESGMLGRAFVTREGLYTTVKDGERFFLTCDREQSDGYSPYSTLRRVILAQVQLPKYSERLLRNSFKLYDVAIDPDGHVTPVRKGSVIIRLE